ncbi:DMT family transporter [Aerophototrophica crusticola]|uniref:DMT family transporter n=1 Tax=Aerophototrophica crusticola TaxID=1709002 RepID=A0A858R3V9_9PROT|nr:DMT family transporter [Rhodospirillaceae bacterium B3]
MPPAPRPDNKALGILLAVLAFALYSVTDATVKALSARMSVPQIIVGNGLFSLVPIIGYAAWSGGLRFLRPRRPLLHLARATCGLFSGFLAYYGYSQMPIADAYALSFTAPLFITALSVPMLGEKVGWRRWTAVAVGFLGVMVMLRPGSGSLNPAALGILAGAALYSMGMMITRLARATDSAVSFAFSTTIVGLAVWGATLPWLAVAPTMDDLVLHALGGTCVGIAIVLLLSGFRLAPAAVVAPFQYTQILWGVALGWLLFGDRPTAPMLLGAGIVIASGLYILYRETVLGRQRAAAAPPREAA